MKYIIANWKMHKTDQAVRDFFAVSREVLLTAKGLEIVICPPYPLIPVARNEVMGTPIKLGAQNLSGEEEGAFTGEVSGLQLEGLVDYVLVGHSERRKYFHEAGREIANKLIQAYRHDLKPVLCFEKIEELAVVNETKGLVLAYEPTAAIGTGEPDTPENAVSIASQAKASLGVDVPVLYGGSVTSANVREFITRPEIAGILVGGASLDPQSFIDLVRAASS